MNFFIPRANELDLRQSLLEVLDNIVYVLDSDTQSDEAISYTCLKAVILRNDGVRHRGRVADKSLHSTEANGKATELDIVH